MALPLSYSLRNVTVRPASTLLTALGVAMTVAVFCGVLSLREGFEQIYRPRGRSDVGIYLRPGAQSEGESGLTREQAQILIKERPEIARNAQGEPVAAAEMFLAVYMEKVGGGLTNVPLRGIQPKSLEVLGDGVRLLEGRWLRFGADEVVVGRPLTSRMQGVGLGETIMLNVTPFQVVGVFDAEGAQGSEVWGDVDRMMDALERPVFQRVVARIVPGTDVEAVDTALRSDRRTPMQLVSEREYLRRQTTMLGGALQFLGGFLTVVMGAAAVLGSMNTMLAAVASRTHEIGMLLAIGFRRWAVFLAFVLESIAIGVVGGALGVLIVLPFNGYETGAVNWSTFTDVSFAFRLTPGLVGSAFLVSLVLGAIGGAAPAWRAARLRPVEAIRQM